MNRAVYVIFVFTVFTFNVSKSYSQKNETKLRYLDSIAFSALESNSDQTTKHANALLKASSKLPPSIFRVNGNIILGIVNKEKGYFVTSLNHYLKALNAAEDIKDEGRRSSCLNNIGTVYQLQGNYQKAKEYFQKSLDIEENLNNSLQKSIRLYNIGEVYRDLDSFDLALSYFNQSLMIEKKANNSEGIIYALLGVSEVYIKTERSADARYSLENIETFLEKNNIEESIIYNQLMGDLNFLEGNLPEALNFYSLAEIISNSNNFRVHLLEIYLSELDILLKIKDFEKYSKKAEKYIALQRELNDIKIKNQLEDLTFQNNLNQKELEITLVQEERDLAIKNKMIQSNISAIEARIVWFLISTLVIMLILIIVGVRKIMHK